MSSHSLTLLQRLIRNILHRYWLVSRGMTLGVRALVLDGDEAVFLVRHSYTPGWHLPGGGVEPGETLLQALEKELREEGNIVMDAPPDLHGIFFNRKTSARDHVAVYVVKEFHQTSPHAADREIIEARFFPLNALPETVTAATKLRINEVIHELAVSQFWSPEI